MNTGSEINRLSEEYEYVGGEKRKKISVFFKIVVKLFL